MKRIAVFTTTRADFGLLSALIREMTPDNDLQPLLFVGGAHLTIETGKTINEIKDFGFQITATFDYLLNSDEDSSLAKALGIATIELSEIFSRYDFDMVCILGDRFELLAIISNAIIFKKPVIHIHGGEKAEGSIDEQIRHMITKAAHIHFVICDEYAQNIRQMGEPEWRIFNIGALAIDNITKLKFLTKSELFKDLGLEENKPTILLTYHPVTLEFNISPLKQIENIFKALKQYDFQVVITAPNIDKGREIINNYIIQQAEINHNYHYTESLGVKNYYNLLPHCLFVIGNSSSGLIEVPYFRIPAVNIGDRQKGRIRHESVIDTEYSVDSIKKGIDKATNESFVKNLKNMNYKFGNGNAAKKIIKIIRNIDINSRLMRKTLDF